MQPQRRSPCDAHGSAWPHTSAGVISYKVAPAASLRGDVAVGGDGLRAFGDAAPDDADNESLRRIPRRIRAWRERLDAGSPPPPSSTLARIGCPVSARSRARRSPQHSVFGFW